MQLFPAQTHPPGQPAGASVFYIALLHYPVIDKTGRTVTTAIANTDIHDIARSAKTFGAEKFYIVNPAEAQRRLAERIMRHWREGYGADHNPCRKEAFEKVALRATLDEVLLEIEQVHGRRPEVVATGANFEGNILTCGELRQKMVRNPLPYLLIFGTGSGIAKDVLKLADHRLEPIRGKDGYNHLAVRSAVAVILDRVTTI